MRERWLGGKGGNRKLLKENRTCVVGCEMSISGTFAAAAGAQAAAAGAAAASEQREWPKPWANRHSAAHLGMRSFERCGYRIVWLERAPEMHSAYISERAKNEQHEGIPGLNVWRARKTPP